MSHGPAAARQIAVLFESFGHCAPLPVHVSATSQTPAAERQMVLEGRKVSGGQPLLVPSQLSATSHGPAAERQTAVLFPSGGHWASVPEHASATSQTPAAERQTVPTGWKASGGHVSLEPSQRSGTSHAPAAGRQLPVAFRS